MEILKSIVQSLAEAEQFINELDVEIDSIVQLNEDGSTIDFVKPSQQELDKFKQGKSRSMGIAAKRQQTDAARPKAGDAVRIFTKDKQKTFLVFDVTGDGRVRLINPKDNDKDTVSIDKLKGGNQVNQLRAKAFEFIGKDPKSIPEDEKMRIFYVK